MAARLHRVRVEKKLEQCGLFAGQGQVIQALAAAELLTMAELAAMLGIRPPTATKTVRRLVALGLVERLPKPEDRRLIRVKLSEDGKRLFAAVEQIWNEVEEELLATFDTKERTLLRKSLHRIRRNLDLATAENPTV